MNSLSALEEMRGLRQLRFKPMEYAPKDGTKVKLRLRDEYGEFKFLYTAAWVRNAWRTASGKAIIPQPIGWLPLKRQCGYEE